MTTPRILCDDVSVHFDERSALAGITIALQPGEVVSLLGPNGAGKSTLLRVLAGLLAPTHGSIIYDGQPLHGVNPCVVYVPQRSSVDWTFPVSVVDVVLMALARSRSRLRPFANSDRATAINALTKVGMERFANIQIGQLSGGQQQRVFLARALLQNGDVLLLDEPFAGVDVPTQELLITLLRDLAAQGKTVVAATHDLAQASRSSDRLLLLNRSMIAEGPPKQAMTAANLRATFGGQAIVPADVLEAVS